MRNPQNSIASYFRPLPARSIHCCSISLFYWHWTCKHKRTVQECKKQGVVVSLGPLTGTIGFYTMVPLTGLCRPYYTLLRPLLGVSRPPTPFPLTPPEGLDDSSTCDQLPLQTAADKVFTKHHKSTSRIPDSA